MAKPGTNNLLEEEKERSYAVLSFGVSGRTLRQESAFPKCAFHQVPSLHRIIFPWALVIFENYLFRNEWGCVCF